MMRLRLLLGALGVGLGLWGAKLTYDLGLTNFVAAAKWLAGGVVLHDAVIGPAVILVGVAAVRVLRGPLPAPVVVGAVVLGTVTLAVVPMLGRFGALDDNTTLLPRNYLVGWLVFAGLVSVSVAGALLVGRRPVKDGERGEGPGGR